MPETPTTLNNQDDAFEKKLWQSALNILTQREHSRTELCRKLARITDAPDVIDVVLDRLEQEGWVSDERFTECFIRMHLDRGHGPVRIRQELKQKGINETVISQALEEANPDWFALAESTRIKKFGDASPEGRKEKARQIRFLQYRGFALPVIMALF